MSLLNSPKWHRYIGDRGVDNLEAAGRYRRSLLASQEQHGFSLYVVEREKPMGLCGFLKREYLDHPDLGFATLPEYEGKGHTFQAAQAALHHARTGLGLQTVQAITTEENLASRRLLEKCGFEGPESILEPSTNKKLLLYALHLAEGA